MPETAHPNLHEPLDPSQSPLDALLLWDDMPGGLDVFRALRLAVVHESGSDEPDWLVPHLGAGTFGLLHRMQVMKDQIQDIGAPVQKPRSQKGKSKRSGGHGRVTPKQAAPKATDVEELEFGYSLEEFDGLTALAGYAFKFKSAVVLAAAGETGPLKDMQPWSKSNKDVHMTPGQLLVASRFEAFMAEGTSTLAIDDLPELSPLERLRMCEKATYGATNSLVICMEYAAGLCIARLHDARGYKALVDRLKTTEYAKHRGSELQIMKDRMALMPLWAYDTDAFGSRQDLMWGSVNAISDAASKVSAGRDDARLSQVKADIHAASSRLGTHTALWDANDQKHQQKYYEVVEATKEAAQPYLEKLAALPAERRNNAAFLLTAEEVAQEEFGVGKLANLLNRLGLQGVEDETQAREAASLLYNLWSAAESNEVVDGELKTDLWHASLLQAVTNEVESLHEQDQLISTIEEHRATAPRTDRQLPLSHTIRSLLAGWETIMAPISFIYDNDAMAKLEVVKSWLEEAEQTAEYCRQSAAEIAKD